MVAPVHNLDPTILPEGSAKLRGGGDGRFSSDLSFLYIRDGIEENFGTIWRRIEQEHQTDKRKISPESVRFFKSAVVIR